MGIVERLIACPLEGQCIRRMEHPQFQFREGLTLRLGDQPSPQEIQQLQALFQAAAFWAENRCVGDIAVAIANSKPVLSVWDEACLIGFARATSDGVYRATIWDVVVHPDYRGAGVGRRLVERMLTHPHLSKVERIYLMTTHQQQFYEQVGFQPNSSTTMVRDQQRLPSTTLSSQPTVIVP